MPVYNIKSVIFPSVPTGQFLSDDGSWDMPEGGEASVFETDPYGDLQPSETVGEDAYFETDGNGDLMPME